MNIKLKIGSNILQKDAWIIEGTHRKHMDFLFKEAERIILIDTPLKVRKRRILTRWIKQKLKLEQSGYSPSIDMLRNMYKWTTQFENDKEGLLKKLNRYSYKLVIK